MRTVADEIPPRMWLSYGQLDALDELHGAYRVSPHLSAALRESEFLRRCVARVLRRGHGLRHVWQAEAVVWEFLRRTSLD